MEKTLEQIREGLAVAYSGPTKKKQGKADAPWHETVKAANAIAHNRTGGAE